ncbi:cupin domain-containing protein [Sphingopyxis macrogoltabida]|uniref:Uncharacterized protein n=1 Tax=Sphingopyxis macrogoltabida TaxID=33050 RepID=A0AAC9AZF9_SPHMC|nr:cupin domain-containing protein [Sphingopyxis macrogoltabida]ALJ16380.1 hypothetical protein LH19_26630 [Sphingopyxis macrogoltabida]AMU92614.1 hypothetical protein ATM17_30615 [Sphingopyxis macrogoltabida]
MTKIMIREEESCKMMTAAEFAIERFGENFDLSKFSEEALATKMRIFHEGSDLAPQLFETQMLPNAVAAVHSHEEDEIIYILAGEMIVGNRTLKRGTSLFIAANTLYGFQSGPEGLQFLNFRPHRC